MNPNQNNNVLLKLFKPAKLQIPADKVVPAEILDIHSPVSPLNPFNPLHVW